MGAYPSYRRFLTLHLASVVLLLVTSPALSIEPREETSRLDALVIYDPGSRLGMKSVSVDELAFDTPLLSEWKTFRGRHGSKWRVRLDARSGVPTLVEGPGIPWLGRSGTTLLDGSELGTDSLAASLVEFIGSQAKILKADVGELRFNREASTQISDIRMVVFDRYYQGVRVQDQRYIFYIKQGLLNMFGATRWSLVGVDAVPTIEAGAARELLLSYMGAEPVEIRSEEPAEQLILTLPSGAAPPPPGMIRDEDYAHALAWRFEFRVFDEPGLWVGLVDAHSGKILAFYDNEAYSQLRGGLYPAESGSSGLGNDQTCPLGCEAELPIPFAKLRPLFGPPSLLTNSDGVTNLMLTVTHTTDFSGPYVEVKDNFCTTGPNMVTNLPVGAVLDLGFGPLYFGPPFPPVTDCDVPTGFAYGPGNTHAARTSFYHVNRAMQWARGWLDGEPSVGPWLNGDPGPLVVNVNLAPGTAFYSGSINLGRTTPLGAGIRRHNLGELPGVMLHEWGHFLDHRLDNGFLRSLEGFADTVELLYDHTACIGDGMGTIGRLNTVFRPYRFATGFKGCTGIRYQDWDQKNVLLSGKCTNAIPGEPPIGCFQDQPTRVAGKDLWTANFGFPLGGGECGRHAHFEARILAETVFDIATRELTGPAYGYDQASAWQIAERLWFQATPLMAGSLYKCIPGTVPIDPVEVYCTSPSRPVDSFGQKVQGLFGGCDRWCYDKNLGTFNFDAPCNEDLDCTKFYPDSCIPSDPDYLCDQDPFACHNGNRFNNQRCATPADCTSGAFTDCVQVTSFSGNRCPVEIPGSDGCGIASLYRLFMMIDDVDGDTGNGTPHAAAIFAALDSHGIACGQAADPENQDQVLLFNIDTPVLSVDGIAGPGRLKLSWSHTLSGSAAPTGPIRYIVRRNDIGCDWSFQQVGTATGIPMAGVTKKFKDRIETSLPRPRLYYRVQPVVELLGSVPPPSVWGPVSNCVSWP